MRWKWIGGKTKNHTPTLCFWDLQANHTPGDQDYRDHYCNLEKWIDIYTYIHIWKLIRLYFEQFSVLSWRTQPHPSECAKSVDVWMPSILNKHMQTLRWITMLLWCCNHKIIQSANLTMFCQSNYQFGRFQAFNHDSVGQCTLKPIVRRWHHRKLLSHSTKSRLHTSSL